jgi:hypothetical protein
MTLPLGGLAALLAVLAGGALVSWLTERLAGRRIEALQRAPNRRLTAAALLWLLAFTPAAGVGLWHLLKWMVETRAASTGRVEIALFPGVVELGFVAAFLALVLTAMPLSLWAERSEWRGAATWMVFAVILAIPLAAAAAIVDWYVVLTPDRFRYDAYFSFAERSYRYDEVRSIQRAPRLDAEGNRAAGHEYLICFADGRGWTTTWHAGWARDTGRRIADMAAERSKVEITDRKELPGGDDLCRK